MTVKANLKAALQTAAVAASLFGPAHARAGNLTFHGWEPPATYPKLGDRALSRLSGIPHTSIGNVRKALANPRDKKAYEAFKEHWEGFLRMDDKWQVALAEEYEVQLRDLLELLEISKAA